MAKKLGFALGSGGSRGVAHIGFLKAMEENGIVPDFVSGCSMGSVVGSCYCKGMSADEMYNEVKKLKPSELFDLSLLPLNNGALLRSNKMQKKLEKYLGDLNFEQLKIPFACVATDLITGKTKVFSGEEKVLTAVVSSSSIPGVFKPVQYGEEVLVDGGVACRVPIDQVRDMGAEVVVGVDVLGNVRYCDKKFNMLSVIFRMIDISDGLATDLRLEKQKPDIILRPDMGDMSQYKFKELDKAYQSGYDIGVANAEKIKQLID